MSTLYDYLNNPTIDEEVTVWDDEYDMEVYFEPITNYDKLDLWDNNMIELAKKLNVLEEKPATEHKNPRVTVDFAELIKRNINNGVFKQLFVNNEIDEIMCDMENIMAGNVSEAWFDAFVKSLV